MKQKHLYSEEVLLGGIKAGNSTIMEYVYKLYYPMVANFVRKNSGNESDAEDLYQEGLLSVFQKIRNGENIQYLQAYVYSVCRLKWLQHLRKRKRLGEKLVETYDFIQINLSTEENEEENTPYKEAMEQTLTEIDERHLELLVAFYFEKLSMEEIATRFGYKNANTAKSKKHKCMDELREKAIIILKRFQK